MRFSQIQTEDESFQFRSARPLPIDLRDDGVEGIPHLVADGGVHDTHVLALDVEKLALDAQGHVLHLNHDLLRILLVSCLDEFYLIEIDLVFLLVVNESLDLVHLLGFRNLLGVGEDGIEQDLVLERSDVPEGEGTLVFSGGTHFEILARTVV